MNYTEYKRIPNKLRESREALGLSQIKVARLLQLQDNTLISRWEKGESIPSLVNACKLCSLYNLSLDIVFESLLHSVIIIK